MSRRKTAERFLLAVLHRMEPERAHDFALWCMRRNGFGTLMGRLVHQPKYQSLASTVFGLHFANPVGLAAGFDKNVEAIQPLFALGFGFLEAGTLTPRPQEGNPLPRLFRRTEERALCNNMGLNNRGTESAAEQLRAMNTRGGILGISLGANKDAADRISGYVDSVNRFSGLADYLALNLSCPNTTGGRELQEPEFLERLLYQVNEARDSRIPLLIKLAPDLPSGYDREIACLVLDGLADGLIISNTMPSKQGGISGRPLFATSTRLLARMYQLTRGRVPLVGVGGIFSAEDAYSKIRAGASLLQLYTALIYEGPGVVGRILEGLAVRLASDGYSSITQAVGCDAAAENAGKKQQRAVA